MNYIVSYGVNNSHMCEAEMFDLYREALAFYESIDANRFKSKVCYKLTYNKNGYVCNREAKKFKFESGTDNTKMLEALHNLYENK